MDEKTGACTACPSNAQSCSINATGTFIDTCNKGYGPAKGGKECQVRFVAGSTGSGDVRLGRAMHSLGLTNSVGAACAFICCKPHNRPVL